MIKVLFICHGNICRSPMAEAVFRHMLEQRGLAGQFQVDSAAVSSEEIGAPVDPAANAELEKHGVPRSGHRARQLSREDYDRFDYILGMDMDNYYRMKRLFGSDPQKKVGLLMAYTPRPREIEDPWYTGKFAQAYTEIAEGCQAFLAELLRDGARAQGDEK